MVDVRLFDALQELAGVGGERFDVAALAFGVDGVEGERGFAGAGDAGDDGEGVVGMSTSMPLRLWVRAPRMVIWSVASTLGAAAEAGAGWVSVSSCVRATVHYRGGWGCVARGVGRE